MRCTECNKFSGTDLQEPEADLSLSDETVTGNIQIFTQTECCGVNASEYNFECDLDLGPAIREAFAKAGVVAPIVDGKKTELDLSDAEIEMEDDPEVTVDDYMKKRKRMYKVNISATVTATYSRNEEDEGNVTVKVTGEWSDECAASDMEVI